jgi:hypothetical protein
MSSRGQSSTTIDRRNGHKFNNNARSKNGVNLMTILGSKLRPTGRTNGCAWACASNASAICLRLLKKAKLTWTPLRLHTGGLSFPKFRFLDTDILRRVTSFPLCWNLVLSTRTRPSGSRTSDTQTEREWITKVAMMMTKQV